MPELFPYQREGAMWLADPTTRPHKLLADEMGLGKTPQAIAAANMSGAQVVVVVCPASLVPNWRREIARWGREGITWHVVSYDRAARGADLPAAFDVLVIDEAHYLKNREAQRTKAIYGKGGLAHRARRVWLLTGTPTPNNPSEMWTHLAALAPDAIPHPKTPGKAMPFWPFALRYCKTVETGFGVKIVGGKNLGELRERLAPFVLRRRKSEVLTELPPISFDTLPVEAQMPKEAGDELALVRCALEEKGVDGLAEVAPHVAQLRRLTGLAKVDGVVAWVRDFLEGSDRKIVLFAQHREVIERLTGALGDQAVVVHGGTPGAQRQAAVDLFQTHVGCRVFIGQIQAAGTGLTLTAASDLLFVEQSWVPAENEQAAMRIHRIGQTQACSVRFATIAGSIDEQIAAACARKLETIRELFA